MESMRQLWPRYIEIKHDQLVQQVKDDYLMIKKFKITSDPEFLFPAKTIALFAHNQEFSFASDNMPALVKKVSEQCKSINDV